MKWKKNKPLDSQQSNTDQIAERIAGGILSLQKRWVIIMAKLAGRMSERGKWCWLIGTVVIGIALNIYHMVNPFVSKEAAGKIDMGTIQKPIESQIDRPAVNDNDSLHLPRSPSP